MANKIQLRRDTAANWTSVNPILGAGEPGLETDTNKLKFGNGVNNWNDLPYFSPGSSTGGGHVIQDGDSDIEQQDKLSFQGDAVSVANDDQNGRTVITITMPAEADTSGSDLYLFNNY